MSITRAQIAALRQAQESVGVKLQRLPVSTSEALHLAAELKAGEARHQSSLTIGLNAIAAVGPSPKDGEEEALLSYATAYAAAANKFWDAFEGQVIEGIEIIRRRA